MGSAVLAFAGASAGGIGRRCDQDRTPTAASDLLVDGAQHPALSHIARPGWNHDQVASSVVSSTGDLTGEPVVVVGDDKIGLNPGVSELGQEKTRYVVGTACDRDSEQILDRVLQQPADMHDRHPCVKPTGQLKRGFGLSRAHCLLGDDKEDASRWAWLPSSFTNHKDWNVSTPGDLSADAPEKARHWSQAAARAKHDQVRVDSVRHLHKTVSDRGTRDRLLQPNVVRHLG